MNTISKLVPAHHARPVPHVIGSAVSESHRTTPVTLVPVTQVYDTHSLVLPFFINPRPGKVVGGEARKIVVAVVVRGADNVVFFQDSEAIK